MTGKSYYLAREGSAHSINDVDWSGEILMIVTLPKLEIKQHVPLNTQLRYSEYLANTVVIKKKYSDEQTFCERHV